MKKIPPFCWLYTCMNTPEEWHSVLVGFGEAYCPWTRRIEPSRNIKNMVKGEYWYYVIGAAVGFALLIFTIALAVSLVVWAIR